MFCKNCGKELSDTAKFCGACGASVTAAPAAETPVENPTYQPEPPVVDPRYTNCPPAPPAPVEPRLGKGKYMWKKAPGGIKATGIVGALVGIACIVICVAMFAQFIFGSILDYPIIELTDADLEFDEDTFKTEVDRIGLELDRLEAELEAVTDSEEKKQLEKTIDYTDRLLCELEYFADTPSIYNSYMIALVLEEVGDELEDEIEFDGETMEDVMQGAENILLVFGGYGLFILLLTLLAVIFRNNFFTVPALVLGFAFPFLFSGMIYGVLFVVCYVAFFILNIVINSNYRKYKREYKKAVA